MDDRSRLDQEQTFTLELTPAADQYQQPLASWMLVWLTGVSKEPGHCLNRARDDGEEWLRTTETDVDIKIAPEQAEWWIWASEQGTTNYDQAVTNLPATSASLTVRCLDYGAVGWVEAYLMSPPSGNPEDASARRAGTTPQEQKYHVPWPLDENGTDI